MKIILLLLLISTTCKSQNWKDSITTDENGIVKYEYIFDVKGSKDDLYTKTKIWLVEKFGEFIESKFVIQTEDKNEGFIIGKGETLYRYDYYFLKKKKIEKKEDLWADKLDLTLKVFVKENKAKIIFTNIVFEFANIPSLNENYDKKKINDVFELLLSKNQEEIISGVNWKAKFFGIENKIVDIANSYKISLSKKSEKDF